MGTKSEPSSRWTVQDQWGLINQSELRVNIDVRKALLWKIKVKMKGGIENFLMLSMRSPHYSAFGVGKLGMESKIVR